MASSERWISFAGCWMVVAGNWLASVDSSKSVDGNLMGLACRWMAVAGSLMASAGR